MPEAVPEAVGVGRLLGLTVGDADAELVGGGLEDGGAVVVEDTEEVGDGDALPEADAVGKDEDVIAAVLEVVGVWEAEGEDV